MVKTLIHKLSMLMSVTYRPESLVLASEWFRHTYINIIFTRYKKLHFCITFVCNQDFITRLNDGIHNRVFCWKVNYRFPALRVCYVCSWSLKYMLLIKCNYIIIMYVIFNILLRQINEIAFEQVVTNLWLKTSLLHVC